ncbi:2-C-methyl-D-erythritol 2,4-cyclodiphosphate synthase [Halalkalibaculum sp. DA3122]|uniref:2-C-methyl-D-erythritol 2,4-cyclodiphosphate synthase n=1 Tax=unclassified Halalkalibaculum TaxID=2964617 RepID=UPI0037550269
MKDIRVGHGYDVHKLVRGRPLVVGGVTIPHEKGLAGHSDADVLLHAVCDALLGAAALGDIGQQFPDDDASFKDIDSRILLRKCRALLQEQQFYVSNVDATVVAERPRLAPHITEMRQNVAEDLESSIGRISVKATTSEGLGFEGMEKGMSAYATVLILKE